MADLADPKSVVRRKEYCSDVITTFYCVGAKNGGSCFPGNLRLAVSGPFAISLRGIKEPMLQDAWEMRHLLVRTHDAAHSESAICVVKCNPHRNNVVHSWLDYIRLANADRLSYSDIASTCKPTFYRSGRSRSTWPLRLVGLSR